MTRIPAPHVAFPPSPRETAAPPEAAGLRWTSWPLRDERWKGPLLPAIMLAVGLGVAHAMAGAVWGVVSVALLATALWRWFVPVHYEMTEQGIAVSLFGRRRFHPWSRWRRCEVYDDGLLLSPFPRPSALDPFRGVSLRFGGNREQVVAMARRHLPHRRDAGATDAGAKDSGESDGGAAGGES